MPRAGLAQRLEISYHIGAILCLGQGDGHACPGNRLAGGGEKRIKRRLVPNHARRSHGFGIVEAGDCARRAAEYAGKMWAHVVLESRCVTAATLAEHRLAPGGIPVSKRRSRQCCQPRGRDRNVYAGSHANSPRIRRWQETGTDGSESPETNLSRTMPLAKMAHTCFSSAGSTGSLRRRLPVAAKIAFVTAGTMADVPGSPIPPGDSVFSMR